VAECLTTAVLEIHDLLPRRGRLGPLVSPTVESDITPIAEAGETGFTQFQVSCGLSPRPAASGEGMKGRSCKLCVSPSSTLERLTLRGRLRLTERLTSPSADVRVRQEMTTTARSLLVRIYGPSRCQGGALERSVIEHPPTEWTADTRLRGSGDRASIRVRSHGGGAVRAAQSVWRPSAEAMRITERAGTIG
jgi:hypothetical protein